MKHLSRLALVTGLLVSTAAFVSPGQAAESAAAPAVTWLSKDLKNGVYPGPFDPDRPDYGLTIDAGFAMFANRDGRAARQMVDALDSRSVDFWKFTAGTEADGDRYESIDGGSLAKLLAFSLAAGEGRTFNGVNLATELKKVIASPTMVEDGDAFFPGQVQDYELIGDQGSYTAENAFGQSLGVIAMAGAGGLDDTWSGSTTYGTAMTQALLGMRCSEGFFVMYRDTKNPTCDQAKKAGDATPDGDGTAMGVSALLAAQRSGVKGLQDEIDRSVKWILSAQKSDGGWGGGFGTTGANTNSTGLLVQALADAGGSSPSKAVRSAIERGRAYLVTAQVTQARDGKGKLKGEIGAIAYAPTEYRAARGSGELEGGRDRWIRATAQAALGQTGTGFYDLVTRQVSTPAAAPPTTQAPGTIEKPPAGTSNRAGTPAPPGAGTFVAPPITKLPSADASARNRLASYLSNQLIDGDHLEVEVDGKKYVDYDATADLAFALQALGAQPGARDRAIAFVLAPASLRAYTEGAPYEKKSAAYAEPLAKAVLLATLRERSGGATEKSTKTLASLQKRLARLVSADGTITDRGENGDVSGSATRQAWTALALRSSDDELAGVVTEQLAKSEATDMASRAAVAAAVGTVPHTAAKTHTVKGARGAKTTVTDDSSFVEGSMDSAESVTTDVAAQAADALNSHGVVVTDGDVDREASIDAATTMMWLGSSASSTSQTLSAMQLKDGGIGRDDQRVKGDVSTSIAAAPVLASTTWAQTAASPLSTSPAAAGAVPQAAAARSQEVPFNPWLAAVGVGLLLIGLVGGALGSRLVSRRTPTPEPTTDPT